MEFNDIAIANEYFFSNGEIKSLTLPSKPSILDKILRISSLFLLEYEFVYFI